MKAEDSGMVFQGLWWFSSQLLQDKAWFIFMHAWNSFCFQSCLLLYEVFVSFKGRMAFRLFWFDCSYTVTANPAEALRAFRVLCLRNHRLCCCSLSFYFRQQCFVCGETSSDFSPLKCFFYYMFCGRDLQEENIGYCAVFISLLPDLLFLRVQNHLTQEFYCTISFTEGSWGLKQNDV